MQGIMAFSPLCHFAPWLICPLALSPPGLLAPWLIRPLTLDDLPSLNNIGLMWTNISVF